jgi:excisionase family DNA binding protein
MAEQQILIPVNVEVFWRQMKNVVEEVLTEKKVVGSSLENSGPVPKLLKIKQVCDLFHVSKPTVYEWMRKGELRSIKIESRRFFLASDIEEVIVNNRLAK